MNEKKQRKYLQKEKLAWFFHYSSKGTKMECHPNKKHSYSKKALRN